MKPEPKIATCCYCGTRAVLKLTGTVRHELACRGCGASLRILKTIPVETRREVKASRTKPLPVRYREKPGRKRKSFFKRAVEEIWDEIEDLFD